MQYKRSDLPRIFDPGIYYFDISIFITGSLEEVLGAESLNPVLSGFIINIILSS